jgi:hypothetical protein
MVSPTTRLYRPRLLGRLQGRGNIPPSDRRERRVHARTVKGARRRKGSSGEGHEGCSKS